MAPVKKQLWSAYSSLRGPTKTRVVDTGFYFPKFIIIRVPILGLPSYFGSLHKCLHFGNHKLHQKPPFKPGLCWKRTSGALPSPLIASAGNAHWFYLRIYIYMRIYVYMYMCMLCMYVYIYIYLFTYEDKARHMYICICMYICVYVNIYVERDMQVCMYTYLGLLNQQYQFKVYYAVFVTYLIL